MNETTPSPLGNVVTIDDERIQNHFDRVIRGSVEQTLNALYSFNLPDHSTARQGRPGARRGHGAGKIGSSRR